MKGKILTMVLMFWVLFSLGQADSWTQVINNGFGYPNQSCIRGFEVFANKLYASTARSGMQPSIAKLWYSSTGDQNSWIQVTNFQPPLSGDISIHSFGKTTLDGGHMWFGTANLQRGSTVYRSEDGVNWYAISRAGFGTPGLVGVAPQIPVFQGSGDSIPYIYAGAGSHGMGTPGQVWRTPYTNTDSTLWELVIDFANIDSGVQIISWFCIWNNALYFGTDDNNGGGQLWQTTDGVNFTKNNYVGGGLGDNLNHVLSSIAVFNNAMYITTTNIHGGELWRSGNGINWQQITTDAFGKADSVNELRELAVYFDNIWVTGYTDTSVSAGTPIWRSEDGLNWIQSNIDGFGDHENNGENPVLIGFGNYMYYGGPNYSTGGQIWRTLNTSDIYDLKQDNCFLQISSNPVISYSEISFGLNCPEIDKFEIYSLTGRLIKPIETNNKNKIIINKDDLQSGLYIYKVTFINNEIITGKIIIE